MSVAGCRSRQGIKVKIFKIGSIYNMLSKVEKAEKQSMNLKNLG